MKEIFKVLNGDVGEEEIDGVCPTTKEYMDSFIRVYAIANSYNYI